MLFFLSNVEGQVRVKQVYDSILNLSLTNKERKQALKYNILFKIYTDKISHADVCYLIAGDYAKKDKAYTVLFLEKELEIRMLYAKSNKKLIAKCYSNLVTFYWHLKDFNKVLFYGDRLIEYTTKSDLRLGKTYRTMADTYGAIGDFQRALNYYNQSEKTLVSLGNKEQLLKTYINKLSLFVEQKYDVSKEEFSVLQLKIEKLKKANVADDAQIYRILYNTGALYYFYKNNDEALKRYESALKFAEIDEDSLAISKINSGIGLIHLKNENIEKAFSTFKKALLYSNDNVDNESAVYNNLGDLFKAKNNFAYALEHYNKAIYVLQPFRWGVKEDIPVYNEIIKSPYRKIILDYLIDKQNAWLAYYNFTNNKKYLLEAKRTLELVDKLIDHLYFESKEIITKQFWREKGAQLYVNAVKICYLLNKPASAFYYIEKNKGILLLEKSSRLKIENIVKLPKVIVEKEREMHKRVKVLEQEYIIALRNDTKAIDSIEKQTFVAKESYYKYLKFLEEKYPEYKRLYRELPILKPKKIQETLSKEDFVAAYILGEQTGYVLSVTKNSIGIHAIHDLLALKSQINILNAYCLKPFENEEDKTCFNKISHKMYREVFPFYKDSLYKNAHKVKIISDGILNTIPFEILSTSLSKDIEETYLLNDKEVSYVQSFSLDEENNTNSFESKGKNLSFILTKFKDSTLTPLSSEPIEWLENEVYKDEEATKEKFMNLYNDASQIFISTHAGNVNESPYLFMYNDRIYPDELYFFYKPKDLVVLNACETSVGTFKKGEGVYSVARGFLNSGTKSVVATLWNINEKSGAEIFKKFQLNLKKGLSKSRALRDAKLSYIENHKHTSQSSPYYWGAITLTGNADTIIVYENYKFKWVIIVIVLELLVFVFLKKKRKHRAS